MIEYSFQNSQSMTLCSRTMIILLVAAIEFLWLQEVSAGVVTKRFPAVALNLDDSIPDIDSILRYYSTLNSTTNSKRTGANISWGSQDIQIGNNYSQNEGENTRYGPRDIQDGNTFSGNSDGTNSYGPTLVQKNNVYHGKGGEVQYGASATHVGNDYSKNQGKKDIYAPVVIQEGNTYPENSGNNTVFGAIFNQTNNTYPESVEANKDALKPIIHQSGNVHPPTSGTTNVVETVVKENGNRFHPSQDNHERHVAGMTIGMMKRQHEEMKRIIYYHLQTDRPTSKRCVNGMMDSERLDRMESLYLEIETQLNQLKALQKINHYRKVICDTIANQCSKYDDVRKWIASSRKIVMRNAKESRKRWESLRKC